jgi:UDP-N-acetylmuramoyl-L-alanyl-D-glutamate--2,6-diaminopimelate ligase
MSSKPTRPPEPLPPAPAWASSLVSVGVTGTNGKTTTTAWLAGLLGLLARPVARVTTLGCFLDEEPLEVPPRYAGFIATMQRCVEAGGRYAALELTSEA